MKPLFILTLFYCLTTVYNQETNSVIDEIDSERTIVLRLEPQPKRPSFMNQSEPPRAVSHNTQNVSASFNQQQQQLSLPQFQQTAQKQVKQSVSQSSVSVPPLPVGAQQPVLSNIPRPVAAQEFVTRDLVTPPPPPPVNIPPDVQNQLIKFFGLDSFGIPGLTGNHPNGFAGAVQELRAAGIPVQGLPVEHVVGKPIQAPQSEVLVQANPSFANELNTLMNEAHTGNTFHTGNGNFPLPDAKPGENGLIGLLSSSVRKLVKDSGVANALSQGIPSILGTGKLPTGNNGNSGSLSSTSFQTDSDAALSESASANGNKSGIRRQQSAAERALAGFVQALGGGNGNKPSHAGLPRIPGISFLPDGLPLTPQGQIDIISLISSMTHRISNGTTLADILPPEQLQTLADNITDALLPITPEDFDISKFMGRWFEGIYSPKDNVQRCIVYQFGGLTKNDKTATFTTYKIYREGSEFGNVMLSVGYGFRSGNKNAMLLLHSNENSDAQPFWVYKLGPEGTDPFGRKQYEYAIVSTWIKYPVTILVRDPDTYREKYESEVLAWLEDQGFIYGLNRAFNLFQPESYSSCQYDESVFKLFG